MRTALSVSLLLVLAASAVSAAVAPTRLEALAQSADAVITLSHEVGGLRAPDAVATLTVLAVAGRAGAEPALRGLRFDLASNAGTDRVYLDANQLSVLRNELDLMARLSTTGRGASRAQGTESCWMPKPELRILCPEVRVSPEWTGISLGALGGPSFAFRGVEARELQQLVDRAIAEIDALH